MSYMTINGTSNRRNDKTMSVLGNTYAAPDGFLVGCLAPPAAGWVVVVVVAAAVVVVGRCVVVLVVVVRNNPCSNSLVGSTP